MREQNDMEYQRLAPMESYSVSDKCNKMNDNQEQQKHGNIQSGKECVHNIAERGATSLPPEHRNLVDVLLDRPTTVRKYEASVSAEPVSLQIDKSDLDRFKELQTKAILKKNVPSSETPPIRKRDTEWITLFEKYVKQVNDSCVFMYKNHHYSTAKSIKPANEKQFLVSADASCNFSGCTCSFHAIIHSNSELIINFKGHICHSPSEQRSRPVRGMNRQLIAEKLTTGYSPDQLRLKHLGDLTENNRKFGNFNLVGSSPHVFRKIRSEAKTSLMLDKDLPSSLEKIKEEQIQKIHEGKCIPGYLQTISISPLRLVLFTEGGLTLWEKVADKVPVSWDATGGIVMSKGKRVFYYELTIANVSARSVTTKTLSGPSFPVTSMLSTSHTTMDLVQWLQDFEAAYRKLHGFKKPFPKPPIVHSDGAIVFQMAALRFFNGDTILSVYLKRCWSIINRTATKEDLTKTVVHSCLGHFMKSVKRQAIKYYPKLKVTIILFVFYIYFDCF
jgi:hypothetical protein